jgi:hypothetical protein
VSGLFRQRARDFCSNILSKLHFSVKSHLIKAAALRVCVFISVFDTYDVELEILHCQLVG